MVRKPQPPGSMVRMYRHFAVITLVLTGAMALFADGENRKALAEEMAAREQRSELEQASVEKFGKPRLIKRKPADVSGSFGSDAGEFGAPMDDAGGGNSGYIPEDFAVAADDHAPAAYGHYGLSEEEWAALTPEQREALEREARVNAARARSPDRAHEIARLRSASAARASAGDAIDTLD